MSPTFSRGALIVSLALYALLTFALAARVPLGASPDEAAHWQYIDFIASNAKLPVFTGQVPPAPGYEFHQPPLYYILCAPLWALLPAGVENYAARAVSLGCGMLTLVCLWKTARYAFPKQPEVAALAPFFAALWPLHIGVGAGANNDSLGGLIAAALFCTAARAFAHGVSMREVWQIGVLAALGLYTKNTTLVVAFAAIIGLYFAANRGAGFVDEARVDEARVDESRTSIFPFRAALTAIGIALLLSAPLLIRNVGLYGDPFALRVFSQAATAGTPGFPLFSQAGISLFSYARGIGWMVFLSTWGFFGGPKLAALQTGPLNAAGPVVGELWMLPLMLVCLFAPLGAILGWRKREPLEAWQSALWRVFCVAIVLLLLGWANFAFNHFSGGQARYGHVLLVPLALGMAFGWTQIFRSRASLMGATGVFAATCLTLTLFNVAVWRALD